MKSSKIKSSAKPRWPHVGGTVPAYLDNPMNTGSVAETDSSVKLRQCS
jgi:hypothetical protein